MERRELLQLAHEYDPDKHKLLIGGWYVSEKLDGMRAFWDGGITRGMPASQVPFANTDKDFRLKEQVIATGLWSRYGKVIRAPAWWLNKLPQNVCLDGELYLGPGLFEETMSIVKQHSADSRWEDIRFAVFDNPSYERVFGDGRINNPQMKKEIKFADIVKALPLSSLFNTPTRFYTVLDEVPKFISQNADNKVVYLHWQERLPITTDAAQDRMYELMDIVLNRGGEGLMLRKPESIWTPKRTWDLLKVKPLNDDEGFVVGYTWGKGKYENLMGSLLLEWCGKRFELSGFTDAERILRNKFSGEKECGEPGSKVDTGKVTSDQFPVGSQITFKYRELTAAGIPKEARYYRKLK